jgi:catechol 2,3-dioxygenase
MRVGTPVLRVRNIDKVLAFYEKVGLQVNRKYPNMNGDLAYELGFKRVFYGTNKSTPLLIIHFDPNARNQSRHSAGLYHFAIVVPDRKSLASTYLALKDSGVRFDEFGGYKRTGAANHLITESLYLTDPENNGIEIYRDRPSKEWQRDSEGEIMMDILPLDLDALVSEELNKEERESAETFHNGGRIGHIHLKVTNLERSIRFYHEKVGLEITGTEKWRSMGIAFLSAGGYHHHIAVNTLNSLNGEAHTHGEAGLEYFEIITPDRSSLDTLRSIIYDSVTSKKQKKQQQEEDNKNQILINDPDGIQILIKSE